VVATDVGGLRHAVRDHVTGLLVAGQEPVAWADALGSVLDDDPERLRMGARAAAHASGFSWDNTAAATLAAYALALDGPR
jgi:D-inositol-3-phosphate glycosyltransferase